MDKFLIVLSYTYMTRLKSRAFLISLIISILFITVITNFDKIIDIFKNGGPETVAVVDETGTVYQPLADTVKSSSEGFRLKQYQDENEAEKAVAEGEVNGLLIIRQDSAGMPQAVYKAEKLTDEEVSGKLKTALQQVKMIQASNKLGLSSEKIQSIFEPVAFKKIALDKNAKTQDEINQARVLVYAMLFIIYFTILGFGMMIAMDVASEKSSRVMEIIISSVSPVKQMLGKIIGIGLLGLTQYVILFITVFINIQIRGEGSSRFDMVTNVLKQLTPSLILYILVFYLLGYFLFSTLLAMLGSLVSRVEDVNQANMPVTMLIVIIFLIAIFGLFQPDNPAITVLSFIPFFTPMVMFLRVGLLNLPWWQPLIAILLNVGMIAILLMIASRIYKGGVLLYGANNVLKTLRTAFRMTKKDGS